MRQPRLCGYSGIKYFHRLRSITSFATNYIYPYDAWNRLTSISTTGGSPTLVAAYRYNGLGQRITEGDGTDTEHLMYDDRWRLISRHDGSAYTEEVVHHAAGLNGFGGASDVDSVIMRRTFLTTGSPQTEDERSYILQNWRQDPAVTITDAGVQVERAHFSPYGRVLGMPAGDVDFDLDFAGDDASTISGWSTSYKAYADLDLDGDIDAADATAQSNVAMGWDALSHVGSRIGSNGEMFSRHIPVMGFLSGGVYHAGLGRMVHRKGSSNGTGADLEPTQPSYSPCGGGVAGDSLRLGCSLQPQIPSGGRCVAKHSTLDDCIDCCEAGGVVYAECANSCFAAFEDPSTPISPPTKEGPRPPDGTDEAICYDACSKGNPAWGAATCNEDDEFIVCNCMEYIFGNGLTPGQMHMSRCVDKCEQLHSIEIDCPVWREGEQGRLRSECRVNTCIAACMESCEHESCKPLQFASKFFRDRWCEKAGMPWY